ncbi:MAG: bacteriocin fulvocin C-related protein [Acidobacteria bacterium]|nr:bacteriocin fulvocin C-related protein [Acidobacteriota bacterium]
MKMFMILVVVLFTLTCELPAISQAELTACNDPTLTAQRRQFLTLDAQSKVDLWTAHLKKQLETRQLNQRQRDVVAKALRLLTPELYQRDANRNAEFEASETGKAWASLRAEMRAEFSLREGALIFERLDLRSGRSTQGAVKPLWRR